MTAYRVDMSERRRKRFYTRTEFMEAYDIAPRERAAIPSHTVGGRRIVDLDEVEASDFWKRRTAAVDEGLDLLAIGDDLYDDEVVEARVSEINTSR